MLLSTHIVEDVHQLCQHLAVLRKGRLFYAGPSQELLHQVEGRVKVLPLGDDKELAALQRQAVVLSTTYEQNAILARVVDESDRFPQPPVPATLEDAYVYCMGGKAMRKTVSILHYELKMQAKRPAVWGVFLAAAAMAQLDCFPSAQNLARLEFLTSPPTLSTAS